MFPSAMLNCRETGCENRLGGLAQGLIDKFVPSKTVREENCTPVIANEISGIFCISILNT